MNVKRDNLGSVFPWLVALAVSIGGCVGEAADDDGDESAAPTGVAVSANTHAPVLPNTDGSMKGAAVETGETGSAGASMVDPSTDPGSTNGSDPEPKPWEPGSPHAR
jgi:hypothetical protein